MFSVVKTWDNRVSGKMLPHGKTWTRRIQCLQDGSLIKLKLECLDMYKEVLVSLLDRDIIWKRFKEGQSIDGCISILGTKVPESLQSRKAQQ